MSTNPPSGRPQSEVFNLLLNRLREATAAYETEERPGRIAVIFSLNAVIEFLMTFEEVKRENLAIPLVAISTALSDLDDGIPTPLLEIKKKRGRKPESTGRAAVRGYAALSVDLLMETDLKLAEAAKRVAVVLNRTGVVHHGGGQKRIDPQTVINWRDAISADAGEGLAAEIRQEMLQQGSFVEGADPAALRRDILKRLEVILLAIRAADEKPTLTPG